MSCTALFEAQTLAVGFLEQWNHFPFPLLHFSELYTGIQLLSCESVVMATDWVTYNVAYVLQIAVHAVADKVDVWLQLSSAISFVLYGTC